MSLRWLQRCFCPGETDNIIVIWDTVIMAWLQMKDTIDKELGERNAMKGKKEKQRQRRKVHCSASFCIVLYIKTFKEQIHDNKLNCAKLLYYNTSSQCIIMMYSEKMPKKSLYLIYIVFIGSEFKFYPFLMDLLKCKI